MLTQNIIDSVLTTITTDIELLDKLLCLLQTERTILESHASEQLEQINVEKTKYLSLIHI